MMSITDRQLHFADVDQWYTRIPQDSFAYQLRQWQEQTVRDEDFAHLFSDRGRPSIPPRLTFVSLLIMLNQGWSYREMAEAAQFDDRVKYALGLSRSPQYLLSRSTLHRHHQAFMDDEILRPFLRQTLYQALESGLFRDAASELVDSFMITGATSRRDTFTLIIMAMRMVLQTAREEGIDLSGVLTYQDYHQSGKPAINWSDDTEKQRLIETLVTDARRVQAHLGAQPAQSEELISALSLLHLVAEQDIEEQDTIQIARKTSPDRVISVTDPEMRHGRKTTSAKCDGYKGHLLVGGHHHCLVTATTVTPANAGDAEAVPALLEERAANLALPLSGLCGDTAYGGAPLRRELAERSIELLAKTPPASNPRGLFSKDRFLVDPDQRTITCPARETIEYHRSGPQLFPQSVCGACALRPQCTTATSQGRTLVIHPEEALLQEARAQEKTPEFKEQYRLRSRVERVIANLTRDGARQARFRGKQKTGFQLMAHALIHNVRTIARFLTRPAEPVVKSSP